MKWDVKKRLLRSSSRCSKHDKCQTTQFAVRSSQFAVQQFKLSAVPSPTKRKTTMTTVTFNFKSDTDQMTYADDEAVYTIVRRPRPQLPPVLRQALLTRSLRLLIGSKTIDQLSSDECQWLKDAVQGHTTFVPCTALARIAEQETGDKYHGNKMNARLDTLGYGIRTRFHGNHNRRGILIDWII